MKLSQLLILIKGRVEVAKQLDHLQRQVASAIEESKRIELEFNESVQGVEEEFSKFQRDAQRLLEVNERLEHSLNGANQKLEILEEITIPNLMKLLATYSSSWDCQTAQNSMRTALAETRDRGTSE